MFNFKEVAVSEDVQNCADEGIQIYGGMDSEDAQWKVPGEMPELLVFMKVQAEINRNAICRDVINQKAMKGHVDLLGPATKVGEELIGIPL
jgi:hypothetical protein